MLPNLPDVGVWSFGGSEPPADFRSAQRPMAKRALREGAAPGDLISGPVNEMANGPFCLRISIGIVPSACGLMSTGEDENRNVFSPALILMPCSSASKTIRKLASSESGLSRRV